MRKALLIIVALFAFTLSFSQKGKLEYSGFFDSYYYKGLHNLSFTANVGFPFYRGDLCKACMTPGISFGAGANYKLWPRVSFGAEFRYFRLKADDSNTKRNISFTSSNMEFIAYGRFYLIDDVIRVAADRGKANKKLLKMYVYGGIGTLRYSPKSEFTKKWPETDSAFIFSEKISYPRLGMIIPMGLGFTWKISNRVHLITEAGYRITFTDYLDDVSKRGNPKKKDGYAMVDIKLQYSPWVAKKKKAKTISAPEKYEGPKGTETWKNRKKEEPVKKNNYYEEETPTEENPQEENPEGEEQKDENQEEPTQEEAPVEELK